jgi:hypothetical protein
LKLEIAVLGKLVKVAHQNVYGSPFNAGHGHYPSYVDPALRNGDYRHPQSMEASQGSKGRETGLEALDYDDDVR